MVTAERQKTIGQPARRRVFAWYPLPPVDQLAPLVGELERDLPKVFRWQNVWRIASVAQALEGGEGKNLVFEVARLKDKQDQTGGEVVRVPVLREGQEMEFRLINKGADEVWVTVLYLDANLGIEMFVEPVALEARRGKISPIRTTMRTLGGTSTGVEGMVVFAILTRQHREVPDFKFLDQTPLHKPEKPKSAPRNLDTPFKRLLASGTLSNPTRAMERAAPTTPAILLRSWVLLP
jgi:hypothetical protein